MSGSLKVTCPLGDRVFAYNSVASATLSNATSWTIAYFYQLVSWDAGAGGDIIQVGNPPMVMRISSGNVSIFATNAGGTKTIGKSITAGTSGHHVCISGSASGTSTIYIDGLELGTTAALGNLLTGSVTNFFGWTDTSHAATLYLSDVAIWGGYPASAADALALATRVSTPATLATPATNYWTLQGTAGPASAPFLDSLGSVPLDTVFGVAGDFTYDAHVIVSTPVVSAFFMTPYVDTTGYLLYIPIYLNPANTQGGPLVNEVPTVNTDPIFTVAGSPVVPTRIPQDSLSSFVAYQFTTPVTIGQAVTMAAAPGWAIVPEGVVGGTSAAGLGSAPMACLNYAGTARDAPVVIPTLKMGTNVNDTCITSQVLLNWARRLNSIDPGIPGSTNWHGTGSVTSFDANNLPSAFTGGAGANVQGLVSAHSGGNGVDGNGVPGLSGTLTLIHGDATTGVDDHTKILVIDLISFGAGWTVGAPSTVNSGVWDPTYNSGSGAWHQITKTYPITWSTSGGFLNANIYVQIKRTDDVGGAISIPILANGQSELGIFEPDPTDSTIPTTIPSNYLDLFDPLAVSPSFLLRHAGFSAIRWMPVQVLHTNTGSGDLVYPSDLDIRKTTDFLATDTLTTTLDITRVDPVSLSVPTNVVCDYINGDASGTIPVALTPTRSSSGFALLTTSGPHGIRTGDRATIYAEPTAVLASLDSAAHFTLTSSINNSQTVISLSAVTNIVTGTVLVIDPDSNLATTSEAVQVVSISGLDLTVIRAARHTTDQIGPTPNGQAKSSGTAVYPQIRAAVLNSAYVTLTGNIDATQTTIPVSVVSGINGDGSAAIFVSYILQLGSATTDEQVEVLSISGLDLTVIRGARGTTALAKTSGTVVYPCRDVTIGGLNDVIFAVSSTQLLTFLVTRAVPNNAPHTPTLLYAQTYQHAQCPVFVKSLPAFRGTVPYGQCSRATRLIAAANSDGACICWVSIPFFATDAAVTAIVNEMVTDFAATPGMRLVAQCSNEVFNGGFDQYVLAVTLAPNAPNPQNPIMPSPGFQDYWDYWASRQHNYTMLARAAFIAAGLDPDRVIWLQNAGSQGATQGAMAFCQRYNLPVQNLSGAFYADMSTDLRSTYISWLPASTGITGATATWSLATARAVMGSNYRASFRYGQTGSITSVVGLSKYLSRYNNGISVDGVAPAHTNAVHGHLCGYEGSCTLIIPNTSVPQASAWTMAMQYDPEWYQTERAFYEANQEGSYQYAILMGSLFPDPADSIMEFACYFSAINIMAPADSTEGYSYPMYRWQEQKAGYGDGSHGGVVNSLGFWAASGGVVTVVDVEMVANGGILAPTINESVRGQVALDWIVATTTPTPSPTLTGDGAILLAGM